MTRQNFQDQNFITKIQNRNYKIEIKKQKLQNKNYKTKITKQKLLDNDLVNINTFLVKKECKNKKKI